MSVKKVVFGTCPSGEMITMYVIRNENGMQAEVIDYGAILVGLKVPDRDKSLADVVLGYGSLQPYLNNPSFFGATVGPNANRIGGAAFEIDGMKYILDQNDGDNNLHSHIDHGYHKRLWTASVEENSVTFTLKDEDGSLGFPGNRHFEVTYTLSEDNKLILHYHGTSDKKTIINFTNHTYFNLKGHDAGNIEDHYLWIKSSHYTPVIAGAIPTGEIVPVDGTPMDFTKVQTVGTRIRDDFNQINLTGGYDHNWVIDDWDGNLQLIAKVSAPGTSRRMQVYTDLPGVQFYAGNFIEPEGGKEGALYKQRSGLCLETQFYPDAPNNPAFPSSMFGPDKEYDTTTVYEFLTV